SLGPFREGAFRLAIDLGIDIVPLAISGTETALPKHSMVFRRTTATVEVLPPVSVAGLTAADAPALADRVRADIARALDPEAQASGGASRCRWSSRRAGRGTAASAARRPNRRPR